MHKKNLKYAQEKSQVYQQKSKDTHNKNHLFCHAGALHQGAQFTYAGGQLISLQKMMLPWKIDLESLILFV